MRIISRFHDYYDVLNDGSDANLIWKRETSSFLPDLNDPFYKTANWENGLPHLMDEVSIPKIGAVYSHDVLRRGDTDDYRRSLLLFCGDFIHLSGFLNMSVGILIPLPRPQSLRSVHIAKEAGALRKRRSSQKPVQCSRKRPSCHVSGR